MYNRFLKKYLLVIFFKGFVHLEQWGFTYSKGCRKKKCCQSSILKEKSVVNYEIVKIRLQMLIQKNKCFSHQYSYLQC